MLIHRHVVQMWRERIKFYLSRHFETSIFLILNLLNSLFPKPSLLSQLRPPLNSKAVHFAIMVAISGA